MDFLCTLEVVKSVCGEWWWLVVCKHILVFSFGPKQALGLGLGLGPSRTIIEEPTRMIHMFLKTMSLGGFHLPMWKSQLVLLIPK